MGRELPHVRACARVRGCAAEYARAEVRVGGRLRSTAAVAAKRRLPCAARPAVASQNSLRSLRSLRSNSRDESDDEARASARRPRVCAARRRSRRCACRPPAPLREPVDSSRWLHPWFLAKPWAGGRACASAAPRSARARGLRIAARRGVERSLFEHRAQAACAAGCRPCEGEFCARPRAPSTAGQSALRADRCSEARLATRPGLCDAQPARPH